MVALMFGAAMYGAKHPLTFTKISNKAQPALVIKTDQQKYLKKLAVARKSRQLKQPYLDTSTLDLPSKFHPKDHQTYLSQLKEKYKNNIPLPKMIKIKSGSFLMGCQNNPCHPTELPAHEVNIAQFEMAETETTYEQWDTCVALGGCYTMPGDYNFGRKNRPVLNLSWDDVTSQYIRWLNENTEGGYRLPSEAEWEYAARAGTTTKRYWGNQNPSCDKASPYAVSWGAQPWWKRKKPCPSPGTTVPVASFTSNPWGLYDMLGSIHEWTNDCENDKDYTGAPTNGSAWRDKVCSRRVARGGAWTSSLLNMRIANRKVYNKHNGLERVGFRLVRDIPQ